MMKGWCVHFTGIQNKKCKLDIEYQESNLPCCKKDHSDELYCEKYTEPTDEQLAEREIEIKECIDRARLAEIAIREFGELEGAIECPNCSEILHFAITYGHIHAECETDGCVYFVQ